MGGLLSAFGILAAMSSIDLALILTLEIHQYHSDQIEQELLLASYVDVGYASSSGYQFAYGYEFT